LATVANQSLVTDPRIHPPGGFHLPRRWMWCVLNRFHTGQGINTSLMTTIEYINSELQ